MELTRRAEQHAALGDPLRLAIVDDLTVSDRSPGELSERHGLPSNLLAHHLGVLERAGLIERVVSSGDARRRYVRIRRNALVGLQPEPTIPDGPVLFVCTHNSARSQLAAALWSRSPATSAGTHPAPRVHPGAVSAGRRAGLDLTGATPRSIGDVTIEPALVITVCDRAHEELEPNPSWWHWSTPDPVEQPTDASFDATVAGLRRRIDMLYGEGTQ
jgi:protein-tyrosine-phosphatase